MHVLISQRHTIRLPPGHARRFVGPRAALLTTALALAGILGTTGCGLAPHPGASDSSAAQLSASSTSVSFGNVAVGSPASQTVTLKNMGDGNVTISGVAVMGKGFAMTSGAPGTLSGGQSITVSVSFTPKATGSAQGTLSVLSDASNATMDIALTGTGVTASSQLQANTVSLSFGNVTVGDSISQVVTLINAGNANVTIISAVPAGNGFSASGGTSVTLAPNKSATVSVTFAPSTPGGVAGNLSISSNASDPTLKIDLSGTAVAAVVTHRVALNWRPSASSVVGYYVYRGGAANGLSKLSGSIDQSSYTDTNVTGGHTYFYAVTSVDSDNIESSPSNQVSVTIPNN
jgi:Cep192 domain 4/Abnormal spindle-like microcephaly-assoc'd, ASPM-SPD-2-Hydin